MDKQLRAAILTALEADAALTALVPNGVWSRTAPEGTDPPFVVYFFQAGTPAYTNTRLSSKQYLVAVKGIVEGFDDGPSCDIDAALDRVLTDGALEGLALVDELGVTVGHVQSCRRESDIEYPEADTPGRYLQHKGGSFRIFVVPSDV